MRASRFSEAQIIGILRERDAGAKTAEVCTAPRNLGCDLLYLRMAPVPSQNVMGTAFSILPMANSNRAARRLRIEVTAATLREASHRGNQELAMGEAGIAIWLEGFYQRTLALATRRGLPPLDRKAFWLLLAGEMGALATREQTAALLRLGPEMEQFEALRRVLSWRAV